MKKKLLYLSSRLPWPAIGGEKNKTLQQLKILAGEYSITLISFGNKSKDQDAIKALSAYAPEIYLIEESRLLKLLRCCKSLFDYTPIQIHLYYSKKFQKKVDELLPSHDILFCNLIRTAKYGLKTKKPKFLDLADSIGLHYLNAAEKISSFAWRMIYKFEGPRLLAFEKECISNFDKSFLFNPTEVAKLNGNSAKLICLPHGVNDFLFTHNSIQPMNLNRICFLGKMDYRPNIEAALWFAREAMPLLDKHFEFWIIGAYPTAEILQLAKDDHRIKVTGFVDDPFALIKASLCSVIPVFTGGGIQNKLIEAMALGTICITTSFCIKALPNVQVGKQLLVEDNAVGMVKKINELYANYDSSTEMKSAAKNYILENLTWAAYGKLLIDNLNSK